MRVSPRIDILPGDHAPAVHMKIRFPHSNGKAEQSVKAALINCPEVSFELVWSQAIADLALDDERPSFIAEYQGVRQPLTERLRFGKFRYSG